MSRKGRSDLNTVDYAELAEDSYKDRSPGALTLGHCCSLSPHKAETS
jgi:hypothetical protein